MMLWIKHSCATFWHSCKIYCQHLWFSNLYGLSFITTVISHPKYWFHFSLQPQDCQCFVNISPTTNVRQNRGPVSPSSNYTLDYPTEKGVRGLRARGLRAKIRAGFWNLCSCFRKWLWVKKCWAHRLGPKTLCSYLTFKFMNDFCLQKIYYGKIYLGRLHRSWECIKITR